MKIPLNKSNMMGAVETLFTAFRINDKKAKGRLTKCFYEVSSQWCENAKYLGTMWKEALEIPLIALLGNCTEISTELTEVAEKGYISYTLPNNRLLPMKDTTFWRIDFSGISVSLRHVLAEYLLSEILNNVVKGQMEEGLRVVIDEFPNFNFSSQSAFGRILVEGRKYNLGLCLATQFLKGAFSNKRMAQLGQAGMSFYFQPSSEEKNMIAKALAEDIAERNVYKELLSSLQRGECIMQAPHTIGSSRCISTKPRKVNIIMNEWFKR